MQLNAEKNAADYIKVATKCLRLVKEVQGDCMLFNLPCSLGIPVRRSGNLFHNRMGRNLRLGWQRGSRLVLV